VRLLVVEDESRVLGFIAQSLREAGFAVDGAGDGHEGLQLALVHPYDAIVLDLMLPRKTGLQVLEGLRAAGRATPVLVLTARDSIGDRVRGLDAGADDYLTKPFAIAELLARVRSLLRRGSATPSVLRVGDLCIDLLTRKVERAGRPIELTAKEFALLEYLARHTGEVVTRTMILEHVWDMNFDGLSNVVDVYIRYLRRKIDEPFESKLIHTRRGLGYMLTDAP
jgi:heavy metal response regulator